MPFPILKAKVPPGQPIKVSVRKSLAFSLLDRYLSLLVSIVSTMVLARLLTPAELGVYSVAMALLIMAATLRDMGAGNYLVQEKELTTDRIRAVWAVQLGIGVLLALTVTLLSTPAARFFREPAIRDIMLLLALNYLVNPFGSLTYAWLMREMRYDAIAVMRLSSTMVGALVSMFLAWRGHGAISLAWGSLSATAVNAGVSMFFRPPGYPWIPGTRELRRVLTFGVQLTGSTAINTVSAASPEFLLGKFQGMAAAGYYSRANGLVAMFNRLVVDAVYSVALSMFSQQSRSGRSYAEPFIRALSYLTVLSWSFTAGLVLLAHPATMLLYGEQWGPSVPLTRWLACAAAIAVPIPLCTAALVGAGQLRRMLNSTLVMAAATLCAATLGALLGLAALGPAMVLASCVGISAWIYNTRQQVRFTWSALAHCCMRSFTVAAATAGGPLAAVLIFGWIPETKLAPLTLGISGGIIGFVVAVIFSHHPLGDEMKRLRIILVDKLHRK